MDSAKAPEPTSMIGYPGRIPPADEFQACFNLYGGRTWRCALEVETNPGYAAPTLMNDPEKAYYIGGHLVKVIDCELSGAQPCADDIQLVHAALEGISGRGSTSKVFGSAQIAAVQYWQLAYPDDLNLV